MFAQVKRYTGLAMFDSLEKLMDYALNDFAAHGTHVYITDLKT